MRLALHPHPDTPSVAVARIDVDVLRPKPDELVLRYAVTGAIGGLALPAPARPERTDELWKHTCFEAFLRTDGEGYCEFNFSPSTQWAAYRFSGYRAGMAALDVPAPRIETRAVADRYELQAVMLGLLDTRAWRLGLTAVIEETNGSKSYWAVAHPPGKPDFHHAAGFVLSVPALEAEA